MVAAKATTPNASSNSSRHRKHTPSKHPHTPLRNRSIATTGKKSQPPWPTNCTLSLPAGLVQSPGFLAWSCWLVYVEGSSSIGRHTLPLWAVLYPCTAQ
jgi:hypothetical protein